MVTYRRMIVKDLDDSSGYMVLKPNLDDFHRPGRHYNKRGLFSLLKNLEGSAIEVTLLDASLSKGVKTFTDLGKLVEALGLKQGVEVEA
jgi:hypothetical protein